MSRTSLVCLVVMALAGGPLGAAPVTVEQCLTGARQAALQAQSRELLLHVADYEGKLDPAQAEADYAAAAGASSTSHGTEAYTALEVARRLLQTGQVEKARQIVLPMLETLAGGQPPPRANPDYWYRDRVLQTSQLARLLFPADLDHLRQAQTQAEEDLNRITDPGQRKQALNGYLTLLALLKPEEAWQRWQAELSEWGSVELIHSMILADCKVVVAHLDETFPTNRGVSGYGSRMELLAAVLRTDPASLASVVRGLGRTSPPVYDLTINWRPLAEAIREKGAAALPMDEGVTALYMGAMRDLSRLDLPCARSVVAALPNPSERCLALAWIASAVAPTNLPGAREAARALLAEYKGKGLPRPYPYALSVAAQGLAAVDQEVVPELLRQIPPGRDLPPAFAAWWLHHRPEAEAFWATLPPAGQLECLPAALKQAGDRLTPAEKSKWVVQALGVEGHGPDAFASRDLIVQTAAFDPDLARRLWQALPALDPAQLPESADVQCRLDALVATAQAFQKRQPGTSGPEEKEIERMVAAAGPRDFWSYQYQARLADLYASYDQAKAQRAIDQILAALPTAPRQVSAQGITADLIRTLVRVDPEAARKLLVEHQDLRGDWQLRRDVVTALAARDPEAGFKLSQEVFSSVDPQDMIEIVSRLAQSASPATTRRFAELCIADSKEKHNTVMFLWNALLCSRKAEVIADLPHYLDLLDKPSDAEYVVYECRVNLGMASDEVLTDLLKRLRAIAVPTSHDAENSVLAARAERDWDGNKTEIEALAPQPRAEAFLAMLSMRDVRAMVEQGQKEP